MSLAGLVAFNLLLNGVGSFAIAWILARGALWMFRASPGRAHVALLALPFVKLAADLARGVPAQSFLWLRARGVPQELGSFRVGFGVSWLVPRFDLALGALAGGQTYTQSAPDLLAALLVKRGAMWLPAACAVVLLTVAALRLARRALGVVRAETVRRVAVRSAVLAGWKRVGLRRAGIFVSPDVAGSPFAGGVWRPYVVFPKGVWDALDPAERRAALAHELAHVAEHHVLVTALAGVVRDVFWFVPFVGAAERALRAACELAADARAVERGSGPAVLASALVRTREALLPTEEGTAVLAATGASLRDRVTRLLEGSPAPRLGFRNAWVRAAATGWVSAAVLLALAFGNH